jgi:hypothetical protein
MILRNSQIALNVVNVADKWSKGGQIADRLAQLVLSTTPLETVFVVTGDGLARVAEPDDAVPDEGASGAARTVQTRAFSLRLPLGWSRVPPQRDAERLNDCGQSFEFHGGAGEYFIVYAGCMLDPNFVFRGESFWALEPRPDGSFAVQDTRSYGDPPDGQLDLVAQARIPEYASDTPAEPGPLFYFFFGSSEGDDVDTQVFRDILTSFRKKSPPDTTAMADSTDYDDYRDIVGEFATKPTRLSMRFIDQHGIVVPITSCIYCMDSGELNPQLTLVDSRGRRVLGGYTIEDNTVTFFRALPPGRYTIAMDAGSAFGQLSITRYYAAVRHTMQLPQDGWSIDVPVHTEQTEYQHPDILLQVIDEGGQPLTGYSPAARTGRISRSTRTRTRRAGRSTWSTRSGWRRATTRCGSSWTATSPTSTASACPTRRPSPTRRSSRGTSAGSTSGRSSCVSGKHLSPTP